LAIVVALFVFVTEMGACGKGLAFRNAKRNVHKNQSVCYALCTLCNLRVLCGKTPYDELKPL
ncbi:MAG: hypothetical protein WCR52_12630, partial [Bacteroidota bacterium]